mgnify:CR=1 FL=1
MEKVSSMPIMVLPKEAPKTPVFIEFAPEYEKEHSISRDIDRPDKYVKSPMNDCFEKGECYGASMASFKAPSPTQVAAIAAILPVILENGKKVLIAIFDIRDIWNDRKEQKNEKEPQYQAVVLPEEATKILSAEV